MSLMKVRMRCPECFFEQDIEVDERMDLTLVPEWTREKMVCLCENKIPKIKSNTPLDKSMVSINGVPLGELKLLTMGGRNGKFALDS